MHETQDVERVEPDGAPQRQRAVVARDHLAAGLADTQAAAREKIGRLPPPGRADPPQRIRLEQVVAADPGQEIARGARETLVESVRLPAVRLDDDASAAPAIALDDVDRSVARAAVDDDVFERRIVLVEHGADRGFEIGRLVEADRDDRNLGGAPGAPSIGAHGVSIVALPSAAIFPCSSTGTLAPASASAARSAAKSPAPMNAMAAMSPGAAPSVSQWKNEPFFGRCSSPGTIARGPGP